MKRHVPFFLVITTATAAIVLLLGLSVSPLHPQDNADFTVTSPSDGQVLHPGETLQIIVQPNAGVILRTIGVISPIGSKTQNAPPLEISLVIPSGSAGPLSLIILGENEKGQRSAVTKVIQVEPDSTTGLIDITVDPQLVELATLSTSRNRDDSLTVSAVFGNGSVVDVTRSADTRYAIDNSRVASIDDAGHIHALAPGVTVARVNYNSREAVARIVVDVYRMRGDLDGDGDVDRDDLSALLQARNTPATGPGDPRDLNNDGRIDALDARILINLCSRPRCATR